MKPAILLASLAASLCVGGVPAMAKPLKASDVELDRKCAVWGLAISAMVPEDEVDGRAGIMASVGYFIGRYEGATGESITRWMTAEYIEQLAPEFEQLTDACLAKMEKFGGDLEKVGNETDG